MLYHVYNYIYIYLSLHYATIKHGRKKGVWPSTCYSTGTEQRKLQARRFVGQKWSQNSRVLSMICDISFAQSNLLPTSLQKKKTSWLWQCQGISRPLYQVRPFPLEEFDSSKTLGIWFSASHFANGIKPISNPCLQPVSWQSKRPEVIRILSRSTWQWQCQAGSWKDVDGWNPANHLRCMKPYK